MPDRIRTSGELRRAAVHFMWEFETMRESYAIWSGTPRGAIYRLSLESFLLHSRNLLNTFYEARQLHQVSEDDVLARDFFIPPATWEKVRPELPPTLASVKERLNKLVSHLSYSRLDYAMNDALDWRWPCDAMSGELHGLTILFKTNLPEEHKAFFVGLLDP
jgi:hypothetical protein